MAVGLCGGRADESISPKTVAAVKKATVFVKVESREVKGSGSGFVIQVDGDSALIVTNHHVIEPKIQQELPGYLIPAPGSPQSPRSTPGLPAPGLPPRPGMPGAPVPGVPSPPPSGGYLYQPPRSIVTTIKNANVSVVFDSGMPTERTIKAEVLALDPQCDLAVLRIKGVKDLPLPIERNAVPELCETLTIYSFGFPFGKALATGNDNPAITVGKAAISSLRNDEAGDLAVVQIDGSLNPGNSGGPIVDAQGRLVGIAVATIRNANGIGLAIPHQHLTSVLLGKIGGPHLVRKPAVDGQALIAVEVGLIDPLNKLKSVTLYWLPGSQSAEDVKKIKSLDSLPGVKKLEMTLDKQLASAEFRLVDAAKEKELILQAVYASEGDRQVKTSVIRRSIKASTATAPRPTPRPAEPPVPNLPPVIVKKMEPPPKPGDTPLLGKSVNSNQRSFRDEAPDGGLLIGFEIGVDTAADKHAIRSIHPIFRTPKGEVMGNQHGNRPEKAVTVKAKADYAVSGISATIGTRRIEGLRVSFMRVRADGTLDASDRYDSDWTGQPDGAAHLGNDGSRVFGIIGRTSPSYLCGLGLSLKKE